MNLSNVRGNGHRLDMTKREALALLVELAKAVDVADRGRTDGVVPTGVVVEHGDGRQSPGSLTLVVVREGS